VIEICETRDTGSDGIRRRTGRAAQFTLDDFIVFGFIGGKIER
jgi:hypothetical protein